MNVRLGQFASYIFAVGFVVVPVMAALAVQLLSGTGTPARAQPYFLVLAVLEIGAGVLFLERMRRRQRRRAGHAARPLAAQEELRLAALGIGGFAVAESFIVAAIDCAERKRGRASKSSCWRSPARPRIIATCPRP